MSLVWTENMEVAILCFFYYFKQGVLLLGLGIYKMRDVVCFLTVLEFGEDVNFTILSVYIHLV